jgi:hypothetical protein
MTAGWLTLAELGDPGEGDLSGGESGMLLLRLAAAR